jgi:excisionase family DNA binding protein
MAEKNNLAQSPVKPSAPRAFTPVGVQIAAQLATKRELFGDPLLNIKEIELALGCSYSNVRNLIADGRLRSWRASPRGHHKVRLSEIRRYLAQGQEHPAVGPYRTRTPEGSLG